MLHRSDMMTGRSRDWGQAVEAWIDPARLSHLIGLIYDAAIDTTRWPIAMEASRAELNCANSALSLQKMPSGEVMVNVATNIPQHYIDRISGYIADVMEQWGGVDAVMALPISEPQVSACSPKAARRLTAQFEPFQPPAPRVSAFALAQP